MIYDRECAYCEEPILGEKFWNDSLGDWICEDCWDDLEEEF